MRIHSHISHNILSKQTTEIQYRMMQWLTDSLAYHDCVVEPFCPTNENVPFANQRSFASLTRWAAARFVSSNPCTGVTTRDDAVPDVCAEFATLASDAVRSRFDFDNLAAYRVNSAQHERMNVFYSPRDLASPKLARTFPVLTPIMPRPFVSSNAPTSSSASPNAIRFVSFRSSVCAYASLALRALEQVRQITGRDQKKWRVPSATAALFGAVVWYGQRLDHLRRWGCSQPIKILLDLFSELVSITA